jgi:hypothetical protein
LGYLADIMPPSSGVQRPPDGSWLGWHKRAVLACSDMDEPLAMLREKFPHAALA